MDRVEYERWRIRHEILENQLQRVEAAERQVLASLRCPADPVALYAILAGEQPEPWPPPKLPSRRKGRTLTAEEREAATARHRQRNRMRVQHVMFTLLHVAEVRRLTVLDRTDTAAAATAGLLAGIYAGDAAAHAIKAGEITQRAEAAGKLRHKGKWTTEDKALWAAVVAVRNKHPAISKRREGDLVQAYLRRRGASDVETRVGARKPDSLRRRIRAVEQTINTMKSAAGK
ncbi:MAG: hypothetical protein H0X64_08920 [Gemmatimonadaceae bacterium]|nr:hypothetical protein [Gemmatimonadaceae bacterium]